MAGLKTARSYASRLQTALYGEASPFSDLGACPTLAPEHLCEAFDSCISTALA
jgi:hypothetical protein